MNRRALIRGVAFAAAAALTAAIYFHDLGAADAYLSIEEAQHARQVYTLATAGRSIMGERLPMYFSQPDFLPGRDPLWIYVGAALLKVTRFSEAIIRTPSALAGLASVALMLVAARRLFGDTRLGLAAAALLALTPAQYIQSRIATSQIACVLVVMVWLTLLMRYVDRGRARNVCAASAVLGLGLYIYLPAMFMMPVYLAITSVVVLMRVSDGHVDAGTGRRDVVMTVATFAAVALPLVAWHVAHPERVTQLLDYYTANGYNRDTSRSALAWMLRRGDLWWGAFNPGALFFSGDTNIRFSTRLVGHFLAPVALLAAVGLVAGLPQLNRTRRFVIIAGLLTAPLPAMLAADFEIKRWLTAVPFVVLTAACGVRWLLLASGPWRGPLIASLAALAVAQFAVFQYDYHGAYRIRAVPWFGGNMRGAVAAVVQSAADPRCVVIDHRLYPDYWPLYAATMGRPDLAAITNLADVSQEQLHVPPGCAPMQVIVSDELLRTNAGAQARLGAPDWIRQPIPEPGGQTHLVVLRRDR